MTGDHPETGRRFRAADKAYRDGDMAGLRAALGNPSDFPNGLQPAALAVGDYPLEYAIYWSPVPFIGELLDLGADPNYPDCDGFPSLLAALSSGRPETGEILRLLLDRGANPDQRGFNDWTPLHHAVALRDLKALKLLLDRGADPTLRTRIDDLSTPLEDARTLGFVEAVSLLETAMVGAIDDGGR